MPLRPRDSNTRGWLPAVHLACVRRLGLSSMLEGNFAWKVELSGERRGIQCYLYIQILTQALERSRA